MRNATITQVDPKEQYFFDKLVKTMKKAESQFRDFLSNADSYNEELKGKKILKGLFITGDIALKGFLKPSLECVVSQLCDDAKSKNQRNDVNMDFVFTVEEVIIPPPEAVYKINGIMRKIAKPTIKDIGYAQLTDGVKNNYRQAVRVLVYPLKRGLRNSLRHKVFPKTEVVFEVMAGTVAYW